MDTDDTAQYGAPEVVLGDVIAPESPTGQVEAVGTGETIARGTAALAGVLAAGLALGVAHLLSGFTSRIPSLVVSVGDRIIENVPGSIERWAIETFGESDKLALIVGTVIISLLLGAFTGIAAARRFRSAWVVFGLFGLLGGMAATRQAFGIFGLLRIGRGSTVEGAGWWGWLAAIIAAAVGIATLRFLLNAARRAATTEGSALGASVPNRRAFVGAATAVAAASVVTPLFGRLLRGRQAAAIENDRDVIAATLETQPEPTAAVETPTPQAAMGQANYDDVEGISTLITPNDNFYRIDSALVVPQIDVDTWSMKITGLVDNELEFTFDDLLDMDLVEEHVTLSCVSNEVGGHLVGTAKWLGVPLKRLLDQAGVQSDAVQMVGRSVDGWTGAFPVSYLDDPDRIALVAVAMNDEPLPVRHGFPVRLVIAGLYGYVSATKWLAEIELVDADFDGYWITRGWSKLGPIKTQSRIDVPASNARLEAGMQAIAGVAWAPDRGVEKVEVQVTAVDAEGEGDWQICELSDEFSDESWRQWYLPWDAPAGDFAIRVRATDGTGETQTSTLARPAPSGATGWHTIGVRVT